MGIIGVLLTILKIIGLILLGLLTLVLVIVLLFLFVPFRYKTRVKYIAKQLEAEGEVSFLFKFLRLRFAYEKELSYDAKIAFFTLMSNKTTVVEKSADSKNDLEVEEVKEINLEERPDKSDKNTDSKQERANKEESHKDSAKGETAKKPESKKTETEKAEKKEKKKKDKIKKDKKKLNIFDKIEKIKEKTEAKREAFKEKFKSINNKKEAVLKFINAEGTAEGIFYLLAQSKILLKMMLPSKVKGWLRFGTGDVYTEGRYLSYLCFLYPLYSGKFEIIPEWEEEIIEADVLLSGKITMFVALLIALRLLFNKKVKSLRRNFNRCKKSFAKS